VSSYIYNFDIDITAEMFMRTILSIPFLVILSSLTFAQDLGLKVAPGL
jgi:hypothetical protein